MAKGQNTLLDLDIDKLFETHTLQDIEKIHDLFESEIERKRIELRSMVGDRYRDVLAASDAIKWMQNISEQTVTNIQRILDQSDALVNCSTQSSAVPKQVTVPPEIVEERTIAIQIRLFIIMNEEIFASLASDETFKAAQIYLLTQHIYTGLRLLRKNILERIPFLEKLKNTLDLLRVEILSKIESKLKKNQLDTEETCSNLNALLLLESRSLPELLKFFTSYRLVALKSVMKESSQTSVRIKITEMIKSLITSINMLHNCFLNNLEDCVLNLEMKKIISSTAPTTLSLVKLPDTPLIAYIPEITKKFKPKCINFGKLNQQDCAVIINDWLVNTKEIIDIDIQVSLNLVNSIKGLHIIREEAANIDVPENWENICKVLGYPDLSDIWIYLFQSLVTERVEILVTKKIVEITDNTFKSIIKFIKKENKEMPTWKEEPTDVGITENKHKGLYMKTRGFSPKLVQVCEAFDQKYLSLLEEIALYLYGEQYSPNFKFIENISRVSKIKFVDRDLVEKHLKTECTTKNLQFLAKLGSYFNAEKDGAKKVFQSLQCARVLYGLTELCPNFKICCNCNQISQTDWTEICAEFSNESLKLWDVCVQNSCQEMSQLCDELFNNFDSIKLLKILTKWDVIDIQEQTDNNVYKSRIRIPMKPSCILQEVLNYLNNYLNKLIPHTFAKQIHQQFIEENVTVIFLKYDNFVRNKNIGQIIALQFLFDVKFLTTFCVARENLKLMQKSQEICDVLRKTIDPFDLDVFYKYLQHNVKQSVLQSQVILGCLLPSSAQLASIGLLEKNKHHEQNPSILALSIPTTETWFPLLPVTSPLLKKTQTPIAQPKDNEPLTRSFTDALSSTSKKAVDAGASVRSGAAALFGAMTNDWFS